LNREGYTKLKAIVKENVKGVLLENKKLISVSFAALIQTLKNDPQMVKLIYNISSSPNNGKQGQDNNNNITNYLEVNKNSILDFAEKNYQNLVEVLTNDSISGVAASSLSNPASSLPQSSLSTFPNLSTQSDTYRIEESKVYHNSKEEE
jgi:hypothetical protein